MKPLAMASHLLIALPAVHGQNLVYNGSFEEYTECPDQLSQMHRATGWIRYRGTPDYFNRCSPVDSGTPIDQMLGIPLNSFGWQEAATGDAYAGAYTWTGFPEDYREHFGSMLSAPLQVGIPVYLSFKVSPAEMNQMDVIRWTVEGMGMRFVMEPYLHDTVWPPMPNAAALYMAAPPMDTTAWYQVSGVYVPDSAYQYVVLGNFFSDSSITPTVLNPNGTSDVAYVYIDDV